MDWSLFAIFFGACCAAAATGSMFAPGAWYRGLDKPTWTPPDWLFPVAWTVLYISIAFAAARVAPMEGSAYVMAFWALQIALNTLWTPVFFGLQRLGAGLVIIGLLWLSVLGLLAMLWPMDTLAFWITSPYLVWVSVAAALNLSIWLRNRTVQIA